MKGIMYMWKHFLLINNVGAGLAEFIYEHLRCQSMDVVYDLYLGIGHF